MSHDGLRRRVEQLAPTGLSAGEIAAQLAAEGHRDGASRATVGRILRELRGPVRAPRVQAPKPKPMAAAAPVAPVVPSPYVPDEEAIDTHLEAVAEFIDRRVDEAVDAELEDAEALRDRLLNRGAAAGWPSCPSCGVPVPPKGAP